MLLEAAGKACVTLSRMIVQTKDQAVKTVLTSTPYKTIAFARSYAGAIEPIVIPEVDSEAFQEAQKQAADLASHHKTLNHESKEN